MEQGSSPTVPGEAVSHVTRALAEDDRWVGQPDPATLIMTCANCGATMDERKCKLICRCGYFLSCSDYA